jgi:hypothetical protein
MYNEKIFLPDVINTIPKTYKPATIIRTTREIDKKRGTRSLSSHFTKGYITKASKTEIVKGRITTAAIFKTAPARVQQMKTIRKKMARPELKVLDMSLTLKLCHNY